MRRGRRGEGKRKRKRREKKMKRQQEEKRGKKTIAACFVLVVEVQHVHCGRCVRRAFECASTELRGCHHTTLCGDEISMPVTFQNRKDHARCPAHHHHACLFRLLLPLFLPHSNNCSTSLSSSNPSLPHQRSFPPPPPRLSSSLPLFCPHHQPTPAQACQVGRRAWKRKRPRLWFGFRMARKAMAKHLSMS